MRNRKFVPAIGNCDAAAAAMSFLIYAHPSEAKHGGGQPGSPPGGNRKVPDFGWGNPFAPSGLTPSKNLHVPGIANGKGLAKHGFELDLTSTASSVALRPQFFRGTKSVTIDVGGTMKTYLRNDKVTPAEFVAIVQVLAKHGSQTLDLNSAGAADGGTFLLNGLISPRITGLTIPQNVTAFDYFSSQPLIGLSGDLVNFGSIYGVSVSRRATGGLLLADNIRNEVGGIISTLLPTSIPHALPNVSLTLAAKEDIVNSGTISSSGALNLVAAGSIINALPPSVSAPAPVISANDNINLVAYSGNFTNAGVIASQNSNVQFWTPVYENNITINGAGGTVSALNGHINVFSPADPPGGKQNKLMPNYTGPGNVTVNGGTYDASEGFNLYSGTGDITGSFGAPIVSAHTTGSVDLNDTTTTGIVLNDSTGGSFKLTTGGATALNDVIVANGALSIVAADGLLQTTPGAVLTANNGSLTLQSLNSGGNGTILIGNGSNISTEGTGGPVKIVIGSIPASPTAGPNPGNVVINNISGGSVFFGTNGITSNAPSNTLVLKGSDIVFDTGAKSASAITLNGGVTITADPVFPSATMSETNRVAAPTNSGSTTLVETAVPASRLDVDTSGASMTSTQSSAVLSTDLVSTMSNPLALPDQNLLDAYAGNANGDVVVYTDREMGFSSMSIAKNSPTKVDTTRSAAVRLLSNRTSPSRTQALEGYTANTTGSGNIVSLTRGNVLFAPSADTVVSTPLGTIKVAGNALALVVSSDDCLAVFDLDDSHGNSVSVTSAGRTLKLNPGMQAAIANSSVRSFEEINPLLDVGYRGMEQLKLGSNLQIFRSEFSIPTVVKAIVPLTELVNSKNATAKQVARHMIKTTAVVWQMRDRNGQFQLMQPVKYTAYEQ